MKLSYTIRLLTASLIMSGMLIACTFPPRLYRIDIQQGNRITQEMVTQLKVGMTKERVIHLIGSPALEHALLPNQWEYYFYLKPGGNGEPIIEKRLRLTFNNKDILEHIEKINL